MDRERRKIENGDPVWIIDENGDVCKGTIQDEHVLYWKVEYEGIEGYETIWKHDPPEMFHLNDTVSAMCYLEDVCKEEYGRRHEWDKKLRMARMALREQHLHGGIQ